MNDPITLHRCPPLNAWLSEKQCAFNGTRARSAHRGGSGSIAWTLGVTVRESCRACPGVLKLDAGTRSWPEAGAGAARAAPARRKARAKIPSHVPVERRTRAKRSRGGNRSVTRSAFVRPGD